MFFLKSLYCRAFQAAFRIAQPVLPYREPKTVNSCSKIGELLNEEKATSVLVVTDNGIVDNGLLTTLEESLKNAGIRYNVYSETLPNPSVKNVEDALKLYYKNATPYLWFAEMKYLFCLRRNSCPS